MERQKKPFTKKKHWTELTEEQQQAIRESWKEKLPGEFDVCASAFSHFFKQLDEETTIIPGDLVIPIHKNLTTLEAFKESTLYVYGDLFVDGYLTCMNLVVCGNVYGFGDIDCLTCKIGGMIAGPVEIQTNCCLLRSCILLQD